MIHSTRRFAAGLGLVLGLLVFPASALAALDPAPTSFDFGAVDRYQPNSPSHNFTFTNNEGAPVNLSGAQLSGANASEFQTFNDNCNGFLNDGNSCTVDVQVTPQSIGSKTASLDVDDGNGVASVSLTADVEAGTLTTSPNPIAFDPQPWYNGSPNANPQVQTSSFGTHISSVAITGPDAAMFSFNFDGCTNITLFSNNTCGMGLNFNPTGPTGPATASLVVTSDSSTSPTTTPITADALGGPVPSVDPSDHDFGAVRTGSTSGSQTFKITNVGDFPLQVQQLLVLSGTPQYFPVTSDGCTLQIVPVGNSCSVTIHFAPATTGPKEASVFLISNTPGPVTQVAMSGQGYASPSASAVVTGKPAVGEALTCKTQNVNGDLAYVWLRAGNPIVGATDANYTPTNADFNKSLACRVTATNPVGSVTAHSPATPKIAARDLSGEARSLVDRGSCRVVSGVDVPGVKASGTNPATPESPFTLAGSKSIRVQLGSIDKHGKKVRITPRQLSGLDDGQQTLKVNGKASKIVLAPCQLSALVDGSSSSGASYDLSGATGIKSGAIVDKKLSIHIGKGVLGNATVFAHGQPDTGFLLAGKHTRYNGIKVDVSRHKVAVSGLPSDTGTVQLQFKSGRVKGHGGTAKASATLKGSGKARATVHTLWK